MPEIELKGCPEALPCVSVLMCVFNGERYLREAVESILSQTFSDFEFIIIDDCSLDATYEILQEYCKIDKRLRLVRNESNLGLTRSLNQGLKLVRGEFVARHDADDIADERRFEFQIEFLRGNPGVGLLGTAYYFIDDKGVRGATVIPPLTDTLIRWHLLFENPLCHPSVMLRREMLTDHAALYDEDLPCSQDLDLWSRLVKVTSVANLGTPLVALRKHDRCVSAIRSDEQERLAVAIHKRNLGELLPGNQLPLEEMRMLRRWFASMPALRRGDLPRCRFFLHLLDAFGRQPVVKKQEIRSLKIFWALRILWAAPLMLYGRLLQAPSPFPIIAKNLPLSLKILWQRILMKVQMRPLSGKRYGG